MVAICLQMFCSILRAILLPDTVYIHKYMYMIRQIYTYIYIYICIYIHVYVFVRCPKLLGFNAMVFIMVALSQVHQVSGNGLFLEAASYSVRKKFCTQNITKM